MKLIEIAFFLRPALARSDVIGLWISGFIETFVASFEAQAAACSLDPHRTAILGVDFLGTNSPAAKCEVLSRP